MAYRHVAACSGGLPERRRKLDAELRTEPWDVVMVLGPWRVAGVPLHRPLRGLASDSAHSDQAVALKRVSREGLAGLDAAVVQVAARELFEQVQIDPSVFTVVQYEVPRAFIAYRVQPINAATSKHCDRALERGRRNPHIKIAVFAGLLAKKCINGPPAPYTNIDPVCRQSIKHANGIDDVHDVSTHRKQQYAPRP